jgi:hypothetical protein
VKQQLRPPANHAENPVKRQGLLLIGYQLLPGDNRFVMLPARTAHMVICSAVHAAVPAALLQ